MTILEQLAAKAQVTGDVGEGLDRDLEQAQADVHTLTGGAKWLKEGCRGLASLAEHIRKDFEEGKLEGLNGKQVHDRLLDYNRRAAECILNLAELKKAEALVANGRVAGIRHALELVKRHHETATSKVVQIQRAIESDEQPASEEQVREARRGRRSGEHPGPSALDARRLESLKEQAAPPGPPVAEVVTEESPKRTRKPRAKKRAGATA